MRPPECGFIDSDLACLGCGLRACLIAPNECGYENWEKQKARETEIKERAQYELLKAKFEPETRA